MKKINLYVINMQNFKKKIFETMQLQKRESTKKLIIQKYFFIYSNHATMLINTSNSKLVVHCKVLLKEDSC